MPLSKVETPSNRIPNCLSPLPSRLGVEQSEFGRGVKSAKGQRKQKGLGGLDFSNRMPNCLSPLPIRLYTLSNSDLAAEKETEKGFSQNWLFMK